jgi:CspA family cold shock protein
MTPLRKDKVGVRPRGGLQSYGRRVWSVGSVRVWHREEGWGVIDSPDTPGGCWAHFSHLWHEDLPQAGAGEVVSVSGGFRELFVAETVDFQWTTSGQDGYDYRAVTVRPRGRDAPHRTVHRRPAAPRE